jgi:DNA-binding NarL/FixJ family response regulator
LAASEQNVFALIVSGKPSKLIAFQLGITERTIKAHRKSIKDKLLARSSIDLMAIGHRAGLTTPLANAL